MLFSSSIFLFAFLPAVLLGYYIIFRGMRRAQNLLLLAASLLFYAWGEPWFVLVMIPPFSQTTSSASGCTPGSGGAEGSFSPSPPPACATWGCFLCSNTSPLPWKT